jgi:hypothetical protein
VSTIVSGHHRHAIPIPSEDDFPGRLPRVKFAIDLEAFFSARCRLTIVNAEGAGLTAPRAREPSDGRLAAINRPRHAGDERRGITSEERDNR